MFDKIVMRNKLAVLLIIVSAVIINAQDNNWQDVEKIIGKQGKVQGNILKVTFPRTDLTVKVKEDKIEPALALTGWIAFSKMENESMIMGDLVLLTKEVPGVIKAIENNGLQITAIHNHLLFESPQVMYLHIGGRGNASDLANKIKAVLKETSIPITSTSTAPKKSNYDWTPVENILKLKGQVNGDVIQFSAPRKDAIKENGMEIPAYMGVGTSMNIQLTGKKAISTGDFVLTGDEVNPVISELTKNNILVTAVHSHMLNETPRLFFLHFWGSDTPENIAKGLKAALDKTNSKLTMQ